ncbi:hypothetical protein BKA66DRAFT_584677 [Pyrenochaeta sp. MPI-SDFR-AT-0127]|nr:hypothetical protein BKA66DRAFT_584677 [Pyrenochaeta sp. MPI-SDFR-AT-0127]
MHFTYRTVLLAGLLQSVRGMAMDNLTVEFNTAVASGGVGIPVEPTIDPAVAVRIGTEQRLPGSYTLLLVDEARCNASSPSLCSMQSGLVSSYQPTFLAGKMVYELIDPSKPSSQAPYAIELLAGNLSLLDGSTQLLLNTTDGQPQDPAALFVEPWAGIHTVAGNVYNAQSEQDRPTRTRFEKARKTREARPKSTRPAMNITMNFGSENENENKNHGELLQRTPLIWLSAALAILVVI